MIGKSTQDVVTALLEVMVALRTPGTGCPWDLEQTFESIAPYTIEEAYEVADAIARDDRLDLKDELGDLLLQVVYHARLAEEEGSFAFNDVVQGVTDKMIRRHPHVFADDHVDDAAAMTVRWEDIKTEERALKAAARGTVVDQPQPGLLDEVAIALPALTRAFKLQKKAARVGFDWSETEPVIDKVSEELTELQEAIAAKDDANTREEVGDLLFAVTNLARHLDVDPEQALKEANQKFTSRFRYIEETLRDADRTLSDADLTELDNLWNDAKRTNV